jgi:hypothetical protein
MERAHSAVLLPRNGASELVCFGVAGNVYRTVRQWCPFLWKQTGGTWAYYPIWAWVRSGVVKARARRGKRGTMTASLIQVL